MGEQLRSIVALRDRDMVARQAAGVGACQHRSSDVHGTDNAHGARETGLMKAPFSPVFLWELSGTPWRLEVALPASQQPQQAGRVVVRVGQTQQVLIRALAWLQHRLAHP